MNGTFRCCSRTAVIAGNQNHLRTRLGHTCRHGSHTCLRNQFYGNPGIFVGIFQIIDKLCQVFDRINIVMRRRRNQADSRCGVSGSGYPRVYLSGWQVSAFSRLRTLGHLNLNLLGADQIAAGHAETSAGHLLNGRTPVPVTSCGIQTFLAFSALTGVGFAVKHIHSQGQGFVCFLRNGAIGHSPCFKAFHNVIHAFHFLQRKGMFCKPKVHKTAEVSASLCVYHLCIFFKHAVIPQTGGFLQHVNSSRIVAVLFSVFAHFVSAHAVQSQICASAQRVKGLRMKHIHVPGYVVQRNAAYTAHRTGKIFVNDFL